MSSSKLVLAILILASFATAATLSIHMMTDSHGNMVPCPLMNGVGSVCPMNIAQHITAWQSLFSATTPTTIALLLALVLLLVGFSLVNIKDTSSAITESSIIKRGNFTSLFFNPLRLAFSRGILHPKVYDFAPVSF